MANDSPDERRRLGLNQQEVAEWFGMTRSAVTMMELEHSSLDAERLLILGKNGFDVLKVPMVVISVRTMPMDLRTGRLGNYAVACLSGVDFAEFVRNKGRVDARKVVWFRDIKDPPRVDMYGWLMGMWEEAVLPVFEDADKHEKSLPVYSYPFKEGPMARYEYSAGMERNTLLALELDFESEDDEDDGDGNDGGVQEVPIDPLLPSGGSGGLRKVRTKAEAQEEIDRLDDELASLMEAHEDIVCGGSDVDKESPRWIAYSTRHQELIGTISRAVLLREMFNHMETNDRAEQRLG